MQKDKVDKGISKEEKNLLAMPEARKQQTMSQEQHRPIFLTRSRPVYKTIIGHMKRSPHITDFRMSIFGLSHIIPMKKYVHT